MYEAVFLVTLILLVFFMILMPNHKPEAFDTYYNHAMGAETVYATHPEYGFLPVDTSSSDRIANYAWSTRNAAGMNVYDWYYESKLSDDNAQIADVYRVDFLPTAVNSMVDSGSVLAQKNQ